MYIKSAKIPARAQNILANNIPNRAELLRFSLNAKLAMKIAIVNPILVNILPHANNIQLRDLGLFANPRNSAIKLKPKTPIGLPKMNPKNTDRVTSLKSGKDINTPALASANKGNIR
nr:hypothetical protein [Fluoribacter gormanii]